MLPQTYPEGHLLLMPHPLRLTIKPSHPNHQVHGSSVETEGRLNLWWLGGKWAQGRKWLTGAAHLFCFTGKPLLYGCLLQDRSVSVEALCYSALNCFFCLRVSSSWCSGPEWAPTTISFIWLAGIKWSYVCLHSTMHTCIHTDINWSYV